jgi:hypothetical protein
MNQELATWERNNSLGRWTSKKSISSPDWSKSGTDVMTVTSKSITGSPADDKVAIVTRALVRFQSAIIPPNSGLLVEFFASSFTIDGSFIEYSKVFEVRYETIHDFYKRAAPGGIRCLQSQDSTSNLIGTIHEIEIDFLDSGEPVILWPKNTKNKITAFTVKVIDGQPFKNADGALGTYAGVRYDAIYVYDAPEN